MRVIKPRRHGTGTGTGIAVLVTAGLIAASAILVPNLVTHHADLHIREADSATTYSNTLAPSPTALAPSTPAPTSSSEDPSASADGVPPGDSVTVLNVTEVAAPDGATAPGCRAEVAPALLMNSFIPQGVRLGINPCLRNWIAAGIIASGAVAQILANTIPPPWSYLANSVAHVISNSPDAINALLNDTCGYWAYLYVTWAPPLAWASCDPNLWGGWIHGN